MVHDVNKKSLLQIVGGVLPVVVEVRDVANNSPVLDALSEEYRGKVFFTSCDVSVHKDVAKTLGVDIIPTTLFYDNGEVVALLVGNPTHETVAQVLDTLV